MIRKRRFSGTDFRCNDAYKTSWALIVLGTQRVEISLTLLCFGLRLYHAKAGEKESKGIVSV